MILSENEKKVRNHLKRYHPTKYKQLLLIDKIRKLEGIEEISTNKLIGLIKITKLLQYITIFIIGIFIGKVII